MTLFGMFFFLQKLHRPSISNRFMKLAVSTSVSTLLRTQSKVVDAIDMTIFTGLFDLYSSHNRIILQHIEVPG